MVRTESALYCIAGSVLRAFCRIQPTTSLLFATSYYLEGAPLFSASIKQPCWSCCRDLREGIMYFLRVTKMTKRCQEWNRLRCPHTKGRRKCRQINPIDWKHSSRLSGVWKWQKLSILLLNHHRSVDEKNGIGMMHRGQRSLARPLAYCIAAFRWISGCRWILRITVKRKERSVYKNLSHSFLKLPPNTISFALRQTWCAYLKCTIRNMTVP